MGIRVKLEVKPGEEIPEIGDSYGGGYVVVSFPENDPPDPNIIVEMPDDTVAQAMESVENKIVDAREQHYDYFPLGWPSNPVGVMQTLVPGDIYPKMGFTEEVYRRAKWGAGDVIIAAGDTGFYPQHVAFAGKKIYWKSPWGIMVPQDRHGHGTHVFAEMIGNPPWGVLPDATAAFFQMLNDTSGSGSESDIALMIRAAADYRVAQGVRAMVLNMSLGGSHSSVMNAAVTYATQRGVWCICAAGNNGWNAPLGSPADAPEAVAVGAIDRELRVASFSSGGGTNPKVFGYCFGVDVISAHTGTTDGARAMSGTSMASPGYSTQFGALGAAQLDFNSAKQYMQSHQQRLATSAQRGYTVLLPDFGTDDGGGEPPVDAREEIKGIAEEVWRIVDSAQAGGWQDAPTRSALGSIKDYMAQVVALLPK
jgi:hypothetical protein